MIATAFHRVKQFLRRKWFGKIIRCAGLNGFDREFGSGKGRDKNDLQFGVILGHRTDEIVAAHTAKATISDHHEKFRLRRCHHLDGLFGRLRQLHSKAIVAEHLTHGLAHVWLIINY